MCAINPKIVQKSHNNVFLIVFREVSAEFRELSAYFREVSAYFREVSAYFHSETSFQNLKQVWRNLGPLWQPGVYNDTNKKESLEIAVRAAFVCQSRFF